MKNNMPKNEEEWKEKLSEDQYRILRKAETEKPFTGKYYESDEDGVYRCAGCGNVLFRSQEKYKSGSGWPSFWDVAEEGSIEKRIDKSHGMERVEVVCSKCGGHLGHVFEDGPKPTGKRYCINSAALQLEERKTENKKDE